jgi:hydroxymethylpyrimidine/phosphomethylpyrimidine kinase
LPAVLTIAGSDSGGGAGIQADLKTFDALGVFGTSAITCLTAQNPDGVSGVQPTEPDMVTRQIEAVCNGFPVAAAKTGMLYSAGIVAAVAAALEGAGIAPLVVDPVMVATSGARLLQEDAVTALTDTLLPLATVVTPNVPEAEILGGRAIGDVDGLKDAARRIAERFGIACVVKGGHLAGQEIVDVLWAAGKLTVLSSPRVAARETHGTGCTFAAALAAYLARGRTLRDAFQGAAAFVAGALANASAVGTHYPLGWGRAGRGDVTDGD